VENDADFILHLQNKPEVMVSNWNLFISIRPCSVQHYITVDL